MPKSLILLLFVLLIAALAGVYIFLRIQKNKKRVLDLVFLKITLPKNESDLDEKRETTKDFKEFIGLMEQLLSSLKSIYSKKIYDRLF